MSLDYVRKGEAVKASTVNSLIDAVGGNERMSPDLDVTTTARGPQVSMPSKYGSPNSKPDQLLEVGRYVLSAWPMAKLLLGPELEDCLNSMRYHAADGTVKNAVSAAMIYENSSDCPVGNQISGRLLNEDDFGQDKAAGAAGWVQTYIEDPFGGKSPVRAELWAWEDKEKLAAVFTNVDDKDDVKEQLSGILQSGGADQLSTLTRIDSWILQDGKTLSDGQRNVPAHAVVKKAGTIDYFEQADAAEYKAVLKADLYCFAKEQDGSTKWTWRMPLGAGASCSSGKVHCPSLTYGGNPVVIEVTENEVGSNYDGEANYYDGYLTYGLFTAQEGEECDADEIWLNLSYDYNEKAVVGAFSDQESSTSYSSDGILHRNVLVAKASAFTPTEDTEVGDTSPREVVEHGTWGVLPKDGPKLDTYCKKDSTTEFKSLDWADREGDVVSCECAELHDFDQLETVDPLSTDHIVIRRPDDYDGAELKYISLSSLELCGTYVPPDADVLEAETSSLQTYELTGESKTVLELYKFHDLTYKTTYTDAKELDAHVVIREGNHINYFPVSEISSGGLSGTVSFLGDMRYDTSLHQLQKRVDTLDLATGQVALGQWTMISGGQAVAHSSVI